MILVGKLKYIFSGGYKSHRDKIGDIYNENIWKHKNRKSIKGLRNYLIGIKQKPQAFAKKVTFAKL